MELLTDFSRKMTLLAAIWEFEKSLSHGKARPAEREGFEPSVDLRPHRFSRPARSAAPAPLRLGINTHTVCYSRNPNLYSQSDSSIDGISDCKDWSRMDFPDLNAQLINAV